MPFDFCRSLRATLARAGLFVFVLLPPALASAEPGEPDRVRLAIGKTFDQPGQKVAIKPVVVVGDHAVAGWTQGERGGRALLRREGKRWEIVLCAGKALSEAGFLQQSGVPRSAAERLAREVARAESVVPAELRARFDAFDPAAAAVAHGGHAAHSADTAHAAHSGSTGRSAHPGEAPHSVTPAGVTTGASHPHH